MIKLERSEPTAPGVNRVAEVEKEDLDSWLKSGKWVVSPDSQEGAPKRRGRKPKDPGGSKD